MTARRGFGRIEKLRSGRYRAAYTGPDTQLHRAPHTFETELDAEAWLVDRRREIVNDTWNPPAEPKPQPVKVKPVTFGEYGETWLQSRELRPKTRQGYERSWRLYLAPAFAHRPVTAITRSEIRKWHAALAPGHPTTRARAYGLLRTILGTAVYDEIIDVNPAMIRGGGKAKRRHKVEPLTIPQLTALVDAMPENKRVMTLLAAWCGLRFGELTELRRSDVDLDTLTIRVRRAVTRITKKEAETFTIPHDMEWCDCRTGCLVGPPKSDAGVRDVSIPPHLKDALKEHLKVHTAWGRDGLLFPDRHGGHLSTASLYGRTEQTTKRKLKSGRVVERHEDGWGFYEARRVAGVPTLRWHDLRHTGATLAAQSGATLKELMSRIGHSTPNAALIYQHAATDRDRVIAEAMSRLATAEIAPPSTSAAS